MIFASVNRFFTSDLPFRMIGLSTEVLLKMGGTSQGGCDYPRGFVRPDGWTAADLGTQRIVGRGRLGRDARTHLRDSRRSTAPPNVSAD